MTNFISQADALLGAGRIDDARRLYTKAIQAGKQADVAHFRLASLAYSGGHLQDSVIHLQNAIAIRPQNAEYHYTLGSILRATGDRAQAEAIYRKALTCEPSHANSWIALGLIAKEKGNLKEAESHQREALRWAPDSFPAWLNLGNTLLTQGRIEEAASSYHEALRLNPQSWQAQNHLGKALVKCGQVREALPHFQQARQLAPREFEPAFGLGLCLFELERFNEATPYLNTAAALLPSVKNAALLIDYACFRLKAGDFQRGWDLYETRLESTEGRHAYPFPRWEGGSLAAKTLLISCEQGLGDEIMFASLLPELIAEAAHCIVECDTRLATLFRRSFPGSTVFPVNRTTTPHEKQLALFHALPDLPTPDVWSPSGSLPRFKRRAISDFPNHSGYLKPDPDKVWSWRERLDTLGSGLRIGLSWQGGTAATDTGMRSIPLNQLSPLLVVPNVHWVSLQYTDCHEELRVFRQLSGITVHHWPEAIDDYDQTAALVSALDLVISVCTAVVHLGGALGQTVWVMVPYVAEWRYGHEGSSMPWYPSVRLFRQPAPHAWEPVIAELQRELGEFITASSSQRTSRSAPE